MSLANCNVACEETQSNRVSDFRDFVYSLFPRAILFYFYFTRTHAFLCLDCFLLFEQISYRRAVAFFTKLKFGVCEQRRSTSLHYHYFANNKDTTKAAESQSREAGVSEQ